MTSNLWWLVCAETMHVCCHVCSVLGLDVSRQEPVPPERVHKMRGITIVPASAEVRQNETCCKLTDMHPA
jgi:hypothetical protein